MSDQISIPQPDPLAALPPADLLDKQAAELSRRAAITRQLARLARKAEAEIAESAFATASKGGAK